MKWRLWIAAGAAALIGTFSMPASAHDEPVAGTLVGAGVGAAVAGPPGAAVGAVLGAIIGATVAHDTDHGGRHGHRHARLHHSHGHVRGYERERVVYSAPVSYRETRYYANGGSHGSAACEPERTTYRPRIVHRDDRARATPVAAKTKVKKVCRYVRVRDAATASAPVSPAAG